MSDMSREQSLRAWLDGEKRWKQRRIEIALNMLQHDTNLSTSSLDAIGEAIETGDPLYCLAPTDCNTIWKLAYGWQLKGAPEAKRIVEIFSMPEQVTEGER